MTNRDLIINLKENIADMQIAIFFFVVVVVVVVEGNESICMIFYSFITSNQNNYISCLMQTNTCQISSVAL